VERNVAAAERVPPNITAEGRSGMSIGGNTYDFGQMSIEEFISLTNDPVKEKALERAVMMYGG
jgi:hypothetical protein